MSAIEEQDMAGMMSGGTNQFLTFALNDQEFGIEILRVQEIKNFTRVTPNTQTCLSASKG